MNITITLSSFESWGQSGLRLSCGSLSSVCTQTCGISVAISSVLSSTLLETFLLIEIKIIGFKTCPLGIETFSLTIALVVLCSLFN